MKVKSEEQNLPCTLACEVSRVSSWSWMEVSGHLHPGCFASRERTLVPTQLEAEWAGDMFRTLRRRDKPLASVEDQTLPYPACGILAILTVLSQLVSIKVICTKTWIVLMSLIMWLHSVFHLGPLYGRRIASVGV
jgi:hypothetical protein